MRIVAFADMHGAFDRVTAVLRRVPAVDVALIAGDITTNGTPADVERAMAAWRPLVPRLFAVAGNMDSPAIDAELVRLGVSLDGCCQRVGVVGFFGCSAAPISIGTPYELPEAEIAARAERGFSQAQGAGELVFVPHAPPLGTVDRAGSGQHVGSRAVRSFVERAQPALVICGHIHEARGQQRLGASLVVNCGPAASGHYCVAVQDGGGWRAELF
jgi:hypothetical protein